ncbi:MAG: peptide ABC transporter permease [Nitrospinae bacterium]|jgi:peptide/nickel transport system permease protein|nr:peptide ABC transporter permease [Nitrospinota bacterium]
MSHEGLAPAARERDFEDELPDRNRLAGLASSLRKQKFAMLGLAILMVVMLMALTAPVISPMSPTAHSLSRVLKPPMWNGEGHVFILGTDHLGRDLLSRIIYGSRVSLIVGFFSVVFSGAIGLFVGLVAGYFGGKVDYLLMRLVDFVLSFPFILLALSTIAILGPSLQLIIVMLSLRLWTVYARVVRGAVLSLREMEFVVAAVGIGSSHMRVLFRHILPNVLAPVVIIGSLYLGRMIIIEAGLSFLGLGVPPPTPTWGGLMAEGRSYLYVSWWIVAFPCLAITLTALGANLVGDWLRNVLDPRLRVR